MELMGQVQKVKNAFQEKNLETKDSKKNPDRLK